MNDTTFLTALRAIVGEDAVRTDDPALALVASDVHVSSARPIAVVRPRDAAGVAAVASLAIAHDHAVLPRGGGLSYTGGYAPADARSITIDMGGLDQIMNISAEDMIITVQAGVTWKQIAAALQPLGLRLPFIGTFSGAGATVGGGLGHGALFFGSARYGSAAEIVLGLEVALADGTLLRTGQGALATASKPFLRTFGPDLTGLFTHDGGMFGIKTEASFRLIQAPAELGYASFAFAAFGGAIDALKSIARADIAEEVYILDPSAAGAADSDMATMLEKARSVARDATGLRRAARALASLARGGTRFIPPGHFSLHLTAAGRCLAAVEADLAAARVIARGFGGMPVAPTIPRVARADLFRNLDAVVGPNGGRWAALNAKVAHSDAHRLVAAFDAMLTPYATEMAAHSVTCTRLVSALANHCFSFEPVFHWSDSWQPIHRAVVSPGLLKEVVEPAADLDARALVDRLRMETVELFRALGAASNQIGRTYPFREALSAAPEALLAQCKAMLDPKGLMNPGVLGFGRHHR
ncbi:FAD-binding oxidoreductase [Blastomonas fulva]|uniref:FAD-binding oxidoreductase n=1 Tax=Blastomonas fulva TaxID=1550728 RepID=UPI003F6FA123